MAPILIPNLIICKCAIMMMLQPQDCAFGPYFKLSILAHTYFNVFGFIMF